MFISPPLRWAQKMLFVAISLVVLGLDQWSKKVVLDWNLNHLLPYKANRFLDIILLWNKGITFGVMSGRYSEITRYTFVVLASLAVILLLAIMLRTSSRWVALCTAMIAGGAVGNILDRARYGAVVDFLYCHAGNLSWYVFNVGDSFIVIGVVLWVIQTTFFSKKDGMADYISHEGEIL